MARYKREMINLKQLEEYSAAGLNIPQIAALMHIPKRTFDRWISKDEKLKEVMERGRAKALHNVAATAYQLAVSGECPAMTMFYLKTRGGWRETHAVDGNVNMKFSDYIMEIISRDRRDEEEDIKKIE